MRASQKISRLSCKIKNHQICFVKCQLFNRDQNSSTMALTLANQIQRTLPKGVSRPPILSHVTYLADSPLDSSFAIKICKTPLATRRHLPVHAVKLTAAQTGLYEIWNCLALFNSTIRVGLKCKCAINSVYGHRITVSLRSIVFKVEQLLPALRRIFLVYGGIKSTKCFT